jgi:hypothetical protein
MSEVDIESLLTKLDSFIDTMYVVRDHFGFTPTKEHVATCINYVDLEEMRHDFISEMVGTMIPFVYSERKRAELLATFSPRRSPEAAHERLRQHCVQKFRQSSSQAQFAEMLLCNLLQHYFKAAPLVRKMPITTNPRSERQGADAIHIARVNGKIRIYVGEAKTYAGKVDNLRTSLIDAVSDLVNKHYKNLRSELDLYLYEPFVPAELEQAARDFRDGKLPDAEVHLVSIVAYDYREPIRGSRKERLDSIIENVRQGVLTIPNSKAFKAIDPDILPRLNYIIFPVSELMKLIAEFRTALGIP